MLTRLPGVLTVCPRRLLFSLPESVIRAFRRRRAPVPGVMETVSVRCVPGEPKLTISLRLDGSNRNLQRDPAEPLGRSLARIGLGLAKGPGKAKKHKKNREQQPCDEPREAAAAGAAEVRLFFGEDEVPDTAPNAEAWRDGAVLQVGDARFSVRRNAPAFTVAELPVSLLAGFPVCPRLEVEFGNLRESEFTWFVEAEPEPDSSSAAPGGSGLQDPVWTQVSRTRVYVPTNQDVGRRLKLRCTPQDGGGRGGAAKELVSPGAVEAGPGACTFDQRHLFTAREAAAPGARVVTYNILADVYAQTEVSRTLLYPYCPPYALHADYRQNLIKKELLGYNADIICLQEVDDGVFTDSLAPALDAFGLDGVFKTKERQHEGLSTFYRRSKFRLLSRHDIMLSQALTSDPVHAQLLNALSSSSVVKQRVLQRSTSLQVSILEDLRLPGTKVCVANTHLYWHPKGGNVRLVQMGVALQHLSQVIRQVAPGAPLIFCGDFNSSPSSGVFQLLTEASVPPHHADWSSSAPEESCGAELRSGFERLHSACGRPDYTNYVGGFHGCLDYIFVQPEVTQVDQVIPLPSHQEVTTHQALPSVAHPSDHIALVCDLRWDP